MEANEQARLRRNLAKTGIPFKNICQVIANNDRLN